LPDPPAICRQILRLAFLGALRPKTLGRDKFKKLAEQAWLDVDICMGFFTPEVLIS